MTKTVPYRLISVSLVLAAWSHPALSASANGMTLDAFLDRQVGRIMAADTDGDGRVSRAEMSAAATKGARDPDRMFDRIDANRDGFLDKAEIKAAFTQRFRKMDRNGDGVITPDERMAGRPRQGQNGAAEAPATPQP